MNAPKRSGRSRWKILGSLLTFGWLRRRRAPDESEPVEQRSLRVGHQPPDELSTVAIVLGGVLIMGMVAVVLGALVWFVDVLGGAGQPESPRAPLAAHRSVPSSPHLQEEPAVDLHELRRRESELLHTYGWIDESEGRVHIPIERAIELVAERGLPVEETDADSVRRVLTESGYVTQRRGPPAPTAPPVLGTSPEPFAPDTDVARQLRAEPQDAPVGAGN